MKSSTIQKYLEACFSRYNYYDSSEHILVGFIVQLRHKAEWHKSALRSLLHLTYIDDSTEFSKNYEHRLLVWYTSHIHMS